MAQHHPTTSSTLCRMPHLNNKNTTKQKYKPNHQQTGLPPHSTLPIRGKTTKQTKPQHKSHPIQSLHKHWTNLRRAETRKKKEFNLEACKKETSNNKLKKIMKRQRKTTQMKEQTRNTEVQINEEEVGKLPEKELRIMIVKMIKNLENRMEKMQE